MEGRQSFCRFIVINVPSELIFSDSILKPTLLICSILYCKDMETLKQFFLSSRLFRAGNFCPVCLKVYRSDEKDLPMVCCDSCDRWIHTGMHSFFLSV